MNYEDFTNTELFDELDNVDYDPDSGTAYGWVTTGFEYLGDRYFAGDRVTYFLGTGNLHRHDYTM